MSAVAHSIDAITADAERELTDGFHLVIDALKLNGVNTIYGGAGHSDHRPRPHGAGRRHSGDFVSP